MKLKAGDKAPDFSLPDQEGRLHNISGYSGRWLLLYFYPRDNTPGCTKEACSFRDNYDALKEKLEIVGVSSDSVDSHKKFADKYTLPFIILSDKQQKTIKNYGTDELFFAKRTSFLINPKGKIVKIYERVDPSSHTAEILKDVNRFMK